MNLEEDSDWGKLHDEAEEKRNLPWLTEFSVEKYPEEAQERLRTLQECIGLSRTLLLLNKNPYLPWEQFGDQA